MIGPEFQMAAKLTKVTYSKPGGGTEVGYAAKLGDCSENPSGSWAVHDADSPFPSKFIVSGEADRAAVWRTMLSYGAKGDAWFDSLQAGGSPGALVSKEQATQLAETLRAISTSPFMAAPVFASMVERCNGIIGTIEAAAAGLA